MCVREMWSPSLIPVESHESSGILCVNDTWYRQPGYTYMGFGYAHLLEYLSSENYLATPSAAQGR